MHQYIVHLNGPRLPPEVGNKASRLHFLAEHGYRVPAHPRLHVESLP